jgi:hypothetical protein
MQFKQFSRKTPAISSKEKPRNLLDHKGGIIEDEKLDLVKRLKYRFNLID